VPWFAPELDPLLAVAVATLDENGALIEANAGFLRLVKVEGPQAVGACVARFFVQPDFATFVRALGGADGEIYHGLLAMVDYIGRIRSLRGHVWRVAGRLRVLAEYDIEDLERFHDALVERNHDYASAQLALVQTNLKLLQRDAEIVATSLIDPLTGVGNRRKLEEAIVLEISRATHTGGKLCVAMVDLDHFKLVNDVYGHEVGDQVLAAFGGMLRRHTRAIDIVARFGGEEFVVLMPHTGLEQGIIVADRIRVAFVACRIAPLPNSVTASFGVAELAAGEERDALLSRADKALYEAKRLGRNRVLAG